MGLLFINVDMIKKGFFVIILLALASLQLSCKDSKESFLGSIRQEIPETDVTVNNWNLPDSILQPHRMKVLQAGKLLLVVDNADKTLSLLDDQGNILSQKGGEGRGPAEFKSIVQLHIGNSGLVYLLDMILFRITVFEVDNNGLKYIDTISYENPPRHSLVNIYITTHGNYGVYNKSKGFQTPDNQFLLYELDKNYAPKKQLLEMPGNERKKATYPSFSLYTPNEFLTKTMWDLEGDWFYYISTHSPIINKYNLKNGKTEELSFFPISERPINPGYIDFLNKREEYANKFSDTQVLKEIELLPLFSGFWVQNNCITARIFYPAAQRGMMIYWDRDMNSINYFYIPHEFYQQSMNQRRIFGINYSPNEYHKVMYIDLSG